MPSQASGSDGRLGLVSIDGLGSMWDLDLRSVLGKDFEVVHW